MKKLLVIHEKDVIPNASESFGIAYKERRAARAVLFDSDGKIALLHVIRHHYYKLPGGGVEEGEELIATLERECMEETGCKIKVGKELGIIEEYRDQFQQYQVSHCWIAEVVGKKGEPAFVGDEIDNKFTLTWASIDDAISLLAGAKPKSYHGHFFQLRDLTYLQKAKEALQLSAR